MASWGDMFLGALTGGAAGSAAGPIGIGVGAGVGLLGSLLHKSAPSLPNDVRQAQMADMMRLRDIASGRTETASDKMLKVQTARDIANQYALANTLRSRSPAAAGRVAAQGALDASAHATEYGTIMKAREQQAAEQALAQETNGARAADISAYTSVYAPQAATSNLYSGSLLKGATEGIGGWLNKRTADQAAADAKANAPVAAPTAQVPVVVPTAPVTNATSAGYVTPPATTMPDPSLSPEQDPTSPYYRGPSNSVGQR